MGSSAVLQPAFRTFRPVQVRAEAPRYLSHHEAVKYCAVRNSCSAAKSFPIQVNRKERRDRKERREGIIFVLFAFFAAKFGLVSFGCGCVALCQ